MVPLRRADTAGRMQAVNLIRACAVAPVLLSASLCAVAQPAADSWTFALTPYIWLPNVNGTLKYSPPPNNGAPEVDTGPNNYLQNLSFALMLSGEARKGRWAIVSDLIYLDFNSEKSNVKDVNFGGPRVSTTGTSSAQSSLKGLEWTLAGSYAMMQSPRGTLEVLGGLRYFHVEASSDWQLSATVSGPGGAQTFPASGNVSRRTDVVDGIVGVRGRVHWGESPWFTPYYLDVGGGSSNLTWQSLIGIGYGFKWGDVVLAYRTLYYDQSDDKLLQDFRFSGPSLGATFRF
jgi:hypothetical protein